MMQPSLGIIDFDEEEEREDGKNQTLTLTGNSSIKRDSDTRIDNT